MDSEVQAALLPAVVAIRPLLNRLVFHGIATCRDLLDVAGPRVRAGTGSTVVVHALATAALERITPELAAAGFIRMNRNVNREEWVYGNRIRLFLSSATMANADSPEAIVRDYAVLSTRGITLGDDCTVRVSTLVPQLGLFWEAHRTSRQSVMESEWIEDVIEVVMRRRDIIDEVTATPAELRVGITRAAAEFVEDDACRWALRRALRDARELPAVADAARDRFVRLASVALGC